MSPSLIVKLVCLNVFVLTSVFANPWSASVLQHASRYNHPFTDGHSSTLWGACKLVNLGWQDMVVPVEDWMGFSSLLSERWVPLKSGLVRNTYTGEPVKAPVSIYIPGAFTNLDDMQPRRWMDLFTRRGMHTIIFPNPWGTDFISRRSNRPVGDILSEAQIIYDGIRHVVRKLKKANLIGGPVHVSGVSYGGFLAAMVAALDAESSDPVLTGFTTVMGTPEHLGRTMVHLDRDLNDMRAEFAELSLAGFGSKMAKLCLKGDQGDMGSDDRRDARGLVAYAGFHWTLVESAITYDRLYNKNLIPDRDKGDSSKHFRHWQRNFTYARYFETYAPEVRKIMESESGSLWHWVNRANAKGNDRIRILAADDDPLNDSDAYFANKERMILVKDGGHFGWQRLDWFNRFIERAFPLHQGLASDPIKSSQTNFGPIADYLPYQPAPVEAMSNTLGPTSPDSATVPTLPDSTPEDYLNLKSSRIFW